MKVTKQGWVDAIRKNERAVLRAKQPAQHILVLCKSEGEDWQVFDQKYNDSWEIEGSEDWDYKQACVDIWSKYPAASLRSG